MVLIPTENHRLNSSVHVIHSIALNYIRAVSNVQFIIWFLNVISITSEEYII
jgi:hypothetical protein